MERIEDGRGFIILLFILMGMALSLWAQVSNGGFEEIKNNFPVDWVGYVAGKGKGVVEPIREAHTGSYAILLRADKDSVAGLNRVYPAGQPGQEIPDIGALCPQKKGVFTFWYKVKKAGKDNVRFYIIPMKSDNLEMGGGRATYIIPSIFAGDGRWHFGALAYDYTRFPEVRTVQIAPRINEGGTRAEGEVIIDDIEYHERFGANIVPIFHEITGDYFLCTFENTGDEEGKGIKVSLEPPAGVEVEEGTRTIDIKPGERVNVKWQLKGEAKGRAEFLLRWHAGPQGDESVSLPVVYEPLLEITHFDFSHSLLIRGKTYPLRITVENKGLGSARDVRLSLSLPAPWESKKIEKTFPLIKPNSKEEWLCEVKAVREGIYSVKLTLQCQEVKEEREIRVVVSNPFPSPSSLAIPASARVGVDEKKEYVLIQNGYLRLLFINNPFGYGVFSLDVKGRNSWKRMATAISFAHLFYKAGGVKEREALLYASSYRKSVGQSRAELIFPIIFQDDDGVTWNMEVTFSLREGEKKIQMGWTLQTNKQAQLLAIHSPRLYVGEGEFGEDKDYALFPGLYYMLKGESSIDTEFGDPPFNDQHAPHPYKVTIPLMTLVKDKHLVGIMWDPLQKWNGVDICPSALFASPNWLEGKDNHLFGLFLPSIPKYVRENREKAEEPYILSPGQKLSLQCWLIGGYPMDIVDSADFYFKQFGVPPLPRPIRSYEEEIQLCGGAEIPPRFLHLVGRINSLAQRCAQDLATQREDGSWGFHMDPQNTEMLRRFNPKRETLGKEGDTTIGTCTFLNGRATGLLRYARYTLNQIALEAGMKALKFIDKNFVRPEGAQTWEIPLHAPDILASANGVHLYLEAYRLTGEKKYLEKAIFWAKTGLPFVYMWKAPDRPQMMLYATTPIFGVSFYNAAPWFGIPVQWCGLDYAYALLQLANYDVHFPWKQIAEGITRCAMEMQETVGEHKGQYPDSVNLMSYVKNGPWLNPWGILRNIYTIRSPFEDPESVSFKSLKVRDGKIVINSEAIIWDASARGDSLVLKLGSLNYNQPISTYTVVASVTPPTAVYKDEEELTTDKEKDDWWSYDETKGGLLIIKLEHPQPAKTITLRIDGLKPRENRVPFLSSTLDWRFDRDGDAEGWAETHDLAPFQVSGGTLRTRSTGGDPYMTSPLIRAEANRYPFVSLRMKVKIPPGGVPDGQIFWTREDDPYTSEQKSMHFPLIPDGEFHIYNVKVADSPEWRGTITQIRLDPGSGAGIEVEIDWIKLSEKPVE